MNRLRLFNEYGTSISRPVAGGGCSCTFCALIPVRWNRQLVFNFAIISNHQANDNPLTGYNCIGRLWSAYASRTRKGCEIVTNISENIYLPNKVYELTVTSSSLEYQKIYATWVTFWLQYNFNIFVNYFCVLHGLAWIAYMTSFSLFLHFQSWYFIRGAIGRWKSMFFRLSKRRCRRLSLF